MPPVRNVEQQEVMLIPDGKEYSPGQTAKLLVQAPVLPGARPPELAPLAASSRPAPSR